MINPIARMSSVTVTSIKVTAALPAFTSNSYRLVETRATIRRKNDTDFDLPKRSTTGGGALARLTR